MQGLKVLLQALAPESAVVRGLLHIPPLEN
jgi:hypothetical protein